MGKSINDFEKLHEKVLQRIQLVKYANDQISQTIDKSFSRNKENNIENENFFCSKKWSENWPENCSSLFFIDQMIVFDLNFSDTILLFQNISLLLQPQKVDFRRTKWTTGKLSDLSDIETINFNATYFYNFDKIGFVHYGRYRFELLQKIFKYFFTALFIKCALSKMYLLFYGVSKIEDNVELSIEETKHKRTIAEMNLFFRYISRIRKKILFLVRLILLCCLIWMQRNLYLYFTEDNDFQKMGVDLFSKFISGPSYLNEIQHTENELNQFFDEMNKDKIKRFINSVQDFNDKEKRFIDNLNAKKCFWFRYQNTKCFTSDIFSNNFETFSECNRNCEELVVEGKLINEKELEKIKTIFPPKRFNFAENLTFLIRK
ncbi:hypothetical protein MHBO_001486 [Bonamia ostreae]|uniref:Uncharacterized protein n=1 Tax=Bonamia ostreae TaxID=126728 RepID=A0ABV2AKB8_9EUKA